MNYKTIERKIKNHPGRSAWNKGVKDYALRFLEDFREWGYTGRDICPNASAKICNRALLEKTLLNGAENWNQYSWGGCALIYDEDIAKALCNPSELKKTHNGALRPNKREEWLDVQARALFQACYMLKYYIFTCEAL